MFTGGAARRVELQVANLWSSHKAWSRYGLVGMRAKDGARYAVNKQPKKWDDSYGVGEVDSLARHRNSQRWMMVLRIVLFCMRHNVCMRGTSYGEAPVEWAWQCYHICDSQ